MPIIDVFKGQRGGQSIGGKIEGGALKASICAQWPLLHCSHDCCLLMGAGATSRCSDGLWRLQASSQC